MKPIISIGTSIEMLYMLAKHRLAFRKWVLDSSKCPIKKDWQSTENICDTKMDTDTTLSQGSSR